MNLAVALLHIDCTARTGDHQAPPKLQVVGYEGRVYGRCPACHAWVVVDLTPIAAPPMAPLMELAAASRT